MSQALDLLNGLSPDEMSRLAGTNPNEARIVIGEDRTIYIPPELRRIAVQFDHNIETVTLECPRYWDGHDMSQMSVSINYMRQDGYTDSYPAAVTSVTEDDKMLFDWTISGNVTEVSGKLSFLVCVEKTNVETGELLYHWSSELSQEMYVSGGMKCKAAPITRDPDLIGQILQRINDVEMLFQSGSGSAARISYIDLLASAWQGEQSPYSQVVAVDGATRNSQVDLTPSVDQLTIFYNKDLAFVTENEDGVVTVYAIGQKPANDYRIQVTITEVAR